MTRRTRRQSGLTVIEVVTALVALVVLAAVSIPLWSNHQLRQQRDAAVDALLAVQAAQDRHFASHAVYADDAQTFADTPTGLGMKRLAPDSRYRIEVQRAADQLGYTVIARVLGGPDNTHVDARCHEFRLDEHGRRSSTDIEGQDSTADCWNRL